VKFLAATVIFTIGLLGCATQLSNEGSQVRAITGADKPNCKFISEVEASGHWSGNEFFTIDETVDDAFNDALNTVALVGGDAYAIISGSHATKYVMQAWECGWGVSQSTNLAKGASPPRQIFADERQKCDFIKTIAEGSNWGFTKKRNLRNAKNDAIKLVQEVGGDSYYIVQEILGSIVVVIVEAWRCN
jgi:hypothetical protein